MNWLVLMSGPLNAAMRYAATAAGTALLTHGYVNAEGAQAVSGAILAVIPAVIGMITSTATAKKAQAVALPDVAGLKLNNGATITDPSQVNNSAMNDR